MIGGILEDNIADGDTGKIDIKHEMDKTFIVKGAAIRYKSGHEEALVELEDKTSDDRLSFGKVQVCTVGHEQAAAAGMPVLSVKAKITTKSNLILNITNNTGATINAGEMAITVFGDFVN